MTMALCLRCGALKNGALTPCRSCKAPTTGDAQLDIAFSDHFVAIATLRQLGAVMKEIRAAIADRELANAVFLSYVAHHTPQIMSYTPVAERASEVAEWYQKFSTIETTWQPGLRNGSPELQGPSSPIAWSMVAIALIVLIALVVFALRR